MPVGVCGHGACHLCPTAYGSALQTDWPKGPKREKMTALTALADPEEAWRYHTHRKVIILCSVNESFFWQRGGL